MSTEGLFEVLKKEFSKIYGPEEGLRKTLVMTPGILADFQKMLDKAAVGAEVSEEYRADDGACKIVLRGVREAAGGILTEATVIAFDREKQYNRN